MRIGFAQVNTTVGDIQGNRGEYAVPIAWADPDLDVEQIWPSARDGLANADRPTLPPLTF